MPRRGHLAITDRYPGFCRHQVLELGYLQSAHTFSGESVAFNVQPRVTGQVLIGSSRELIGWERATNRPLLTRMLDRDGSLERVLVRIEVPRLGLVKRDAHRIEYISPVPCPFNYGSVPDTLAPDGDPFDAVVLGPRLATGTLVEVPVTGVVRSSG